MPSIFSRCPECGAFYKDHIGEELKCPPRSSTDEQLGPNEEAAGSSPAGATMIGAWRNVPRKNYRLHDGSLGTEYDAVLEAIKVWERKRQEAEDRLEELRHRLMTAEGNPGP